MQDIKVLDQHFDKPSHLKAEAAAIIKLVNVGKEYPGPVMALKDVNLTVMPKEFVTVIGASGAGKSTLLKLLTREELATSGVVEVLGEDIELLPDNDVPYLRRRIGIVFQDFKLLTKKTVYENVAFALEVSGYSSPEIKEVVPKVLDLVGLADKSKSFPHEVSGGEQQRVSIARAVVRSPRLLIADEPTGNLDPKTAWGIMQLLLKINDLGTTVLLTTHNRDIVNALERRVVTMVDGALVKDQEIGRYTF